MKFQQYFIDSDLNKFVFGETFERIIQGERVLKLNKIEINKPKIKYAGITNYKKKIK